MFVCSETDEPIRSKIFGDGISPEKKALYDDLEKRTRPQGQVGPKGEFH